MFSLPFARIAEGRAQIALPQGKPNPLLRKLRRLHPAAPAAQTALADLGAKTKRGQLGRARAGRIAVGLAYGYEVVAVAPGVQDRGQRRLKPDEAKIVSARRPKFQNYASSIRRFGVACQARRQKMRFSIGHAEHGQKLNVAHRRFLLSGLLRCGCCGAAYTIVATDRYGCAQHRTKNTCPNSCTIQRQRIEQRVLSALKARMLAPELVAEFIKAFAEEIAAAQSDAIKTHGQSRRELADIERKLEGALKAIEDGAWSDTPKARLQGLEARKAELAAKIKLVNALPAPVVRLHSNAADIYSAKVANLESTLNDTELRTEATEALAALIDNVTLMPDPMEPDGLRAELTGDLARIFLLAQGKMPVPASLGGSRSGHANPPLVCAHRGVLSVVAGTRYHFHRTSFVWLREQRGGPPTRRKPRRNHAQCETAAVQKSVGDIW